MLNELLLYLKNFFDVKRIYGTFKIEDGYITEDGHSVAILDKQFFRVVGSIFNDGVYQYHEDAPLDLPINETFTGSIWLLAIPDDVMLLVADIESWRAKYETIDGQLLSPFQSESFGGYSYSKATPTNGSQGNTWQTAFANRLQRYRKL